MTSTNPKAGENVGYLMIPAHCRDGLRRYVETGTPTGSFLTALLSNDLMATFMRADTINTSRIRDYAAFLHNYAPRDCWGSPAAVRQWIGHEGLAGIDKYDTASSASRQHFIDTGRYLKLGEAPED